MEYPIGSKYKSRGKNPKEYVVEDVLKTYNSKGELIKTVYIAYCIFAGQKVYNYEVSTSTISRGLTFYGGGGI